MPRKVINKPKPDLDLFKVLNDISIGKSMKLHEHMEFPKAFNAFMVNRYLSMLPDTTFYALFTNKYYEIPDKLKYLFLCSAIEPEKRFFKYIKGDPKPKEVKYIQNYFQVNETRAEEMLKLLKPEIVQNIVDIFEKKRIVKRG